ncbi:3-methyl-2-oxobutanoate hydroxymethyltransferase [Holophaga foetida]|uniref:3-methyl-2-oxobutanoate hydroxymethyltransferase n=1 Tax=Holophaga foetida TaxID=35839 RepID=UPI0002471CB5|nr:3-methyl-2-oxobutanoate hydroxymethyltransferase [Holophaga foetida]
MSSPSTNRVQLTIPKLIEKVQAGEKLAMLTAYDAVHARLADAAGVDMILVGDSVGNVCLGFDNTLPVSMAMMNHHLEAVARTRPKAFLVVDLPYLSYHLGLEDSIRNAGGFLQRGAQAVKLEGGANRVQVVKALVDAEIPVMGHLGLTPQSVHAMGGYAVQGRAGHEAIRVVEDALRLQDAGCFMIVLEGIPADLGARVTQELEIPTIGIGAGPGCDGQVLVFHDLLGLLPGKPAKFVRKYMSGYEDSVSAIARWAEDVRGGVFPDARESYILPEPARKLLNEWHAGEGRN